MANRPAVPNVVRHAVVFTWVDTEWMVSTFHVEHPAAITQAMIDADRAVLRNWLTTYWRAKADPRYLVREIKSCALATVPPTRFAVDKVYPTTTIVGQLGDAQIPANIAPVISLRTGAVGAVPKPPHGRLYHIGNMQGLLTTAGYITATRNADLVSMYANLIGLFTFAGNVGRWVIVSYWHGGHRNAPQLRGAPLVLPVDHIRVPDWPGSVPTRRPRQQSYVQN